MSQFEVQYVLDCLKSASSVDHFNKLKQFGINQEQAFGVKIPDIRNLAKIIGTNHSLAQELLKANNHEARILASFIDDYKVLTEEHLMIYINGFNSWDVCDLSADLIRKTIYCEKLINTLSNDNEEFRKRTAFVLMCSNAVHNKKADNNHFLGYFDLIEQEAWDNRNFVRKAVNWALRQIGKRNVFLHEKAIECAKRIQLQPTSSAKWIAADALRELQSEKIITRIRNKKS
ncbi:MAG: DNA alkylation repair protein [Paludibacter sp.]